MQENYLEVNFSTVMVSQDNLCSNSHSMCHQALNHEGNASEDVSYGRPLECDPQLRDLVISRL